MENEEHEEWWREGEMEKVKQARNFFYAGLFLLPGLWFVNVFHFWPALAHPPIRRYVIWSAIGCTVYTVILVSWALTFSVGGERLFGSVWKHLAVYDLADTYDLIGS